MPSPVFIACSESVSVDNRTNKLSLFSMIDTIEIERIDSREGEPRPTQGPLMQISAAWMKEDEDAPEQGFDVEFVLHFPNVEQEFVVARSRITFHRPFHRVNAYDLPLVFPGGPGVLTVEGRLRREGEEQWIARQSYLILLRERVPSQGPTAAQPPTPVAKPEIPTGD